VVGDRDGWMARRGDREVPGSAESAGCGMDVPESGSRRHERRQHRMRLDALVEDKELVRDLVALEDRRDDPRQELRPVARADDQGGWGRGREDAHATLT